MPRVGWPGERGACVNALEGTPLCRIRSGTMDTKPYDEPSNVEAKDGIVIVDGPDGVAVSMTPEAADETSHRLLFGAAKAKGQEVAKRDKVRSV